jgi:hypothetical protein
MPDDPNPLYEKDKNQDSRKRDHADHRQHTEERQDSDQPGMGRQPFRILRQNQKQNDGKKRHHPKEGGPAPQCPGVPYHNFHKYKKRYQKYKK